MDDKELLNGLFKGSRKHQMEFLRNSTPLLYSIARKINARDPSLDFDDLVHEGFLHLFEDDFRRLRRFRFKSKLSTYIFTIVRRHMLAKTSGKKKLVVREDVPEYTLPHSNDVQWDFLFSMDAEMKLLHRENEGLIKKYLDKAMESLEPEEQLQIQYHMDGYSTERIMQLFDISNRARIDKRKYTIMQKLKKSVRKQQAGAKYAG
jgi:RNA polymerase sigma factor (sigma-70 family)